MQLLSSTAGWVIELRLQAHAAARKKANARTVFAQRNVEADDHINGVCYPAYDVENLLGEVVFTFSGDYEDARAVAEAGGYHMLAQTILPLGATRH